MKRGDVFKITRKEPKKYHLILLSDVLLTTTETALKSGTYKLHRWVELKDVATGVTDITPEQIAAQAQALAAHNLNPSYAFFITSSEKSFQVVCEGEGVSSAVAADEKRAWMDAIRDGIAECRDEDDEWAAEAAAAVWTPNASACQLCERKFSYKMRRHHCRACGRNVCAGCSKHRRERKLTTGRTNSGTRILLFRCVDRCPLTRRCFSSLQVIRWEVPRRSRRRL